MQQGKWFGPPLVPANEILKQGSRAKTRSVARSFEPAPQMLLQAPGAVPFYANIEADTPDDAANIEVVKHTMTELMRVPTIVNGAIMPDACPVGLQGENPGRRSGGYQRGHPSRIPFGRYLLLDGGVDLWPRCRTASRFSTPA